MIKATGRMTPFVLSALAAIITLGVAGYSLLNLGVYRPSTPEGLIPGAASQDLILILVKVGTLGLSVLLGTLFAPWFGQAIDWAAVGIYALLGLGPLLFVLPFLSSTTVESNEQYGVYAA